jgi:hypothetical protein
LNAPTLRAAQSHGWGIVVGWLFFTFYIGFPKQRDIEMTIIGKTGSIQKGAKKTTVFISPVNGPTVIDNVFVFAEEIGIPTDAAGNFRVTLEMGDYYFRVGNYVGSSLAAR